jgi:hypothetical protein
VRLPQCRRFLAITRFIEGLAVRAQSSREKSPHIGPGLWRGGRQHQPGKALVGSYPGGIPKEGGDGPSSWTGSASAPTLACQVKQALELNRTAFNCLNSVKYQKKGVPLPHAWF